MTTQDEVIKLCEAAGFVLMRSGSIYDPSESRDITDELTKLIALAKQSAYEDAAKVADLMPSANCYGIAEAIRNRANEVTK